MTAQILWFAHDVSATTNKTVIAKNADTAAASNAVFTAAVSRGLPENGLLIVIDTAAQTAELRIRYGLMRTYAVSTSKHGTGSKAGSNRTPLGWHEVTERFGDGKPAGTSFTSRKPDGEILPRTEWRSEKPKDYILSRILWLSGLEPGVNSGNDVDSRERHIYLHGTNQEHLLGKPSSHGCIRFSNDDIVEIFALAKNLKVYCFIR